MVTGSRCGQPNDGRVSAQSLRRAIKRSGRALEQARQSKRLASIYEIYDPVVWIQENAETSRPKKSYEYVAESVEMYQHRKWVVKGYCLG